MSIRTVTIIVLRLLAVVIFTQLLGMLPIMNVVIRPENVAGCAFSLMSAPGIYLVLTALFYLVSIWGLLCRTAVLADFLLKDVADECVKAFPSHEMLAGLACQCFGLFALLRWLPALVHGLFWVVLQGWRYAGDGLAVLQLQWLGQVGPGVGVLLGLVLLFKGPALARWLAMRAMSGSSAEDAKPR